MSVTMTNDRAREVFVTGLRNAHALENEALSLMNRQIERIESYPEVRERMQRHVEETENQIKRLQTLLGRMEQAMASWLDQHLSDVTSRYLQLEASGQQSGIQAATWPGAAAIRPRRFRGVAAGLRSQRPDWPCRRSPSSPDRRTIPWSSAWSSLARPALGWRR